jgi:hypothetical protein
VAKHFIVIFGPPAVGKMAVGAELERVTGVRLFHNHVAIEPVLRFFPFGSPPFVRLVDGFRRRVFEEVAASDLPGLSFTFVWDLDGEGDRRFLEEACAIFSANDAEIAFVELKSDLATRLARNRTPERLDEKRSKRDLVQSEENLLMLERYRMNTDGSIPLPHRHLIFDNMHRSAREIAEAIADALGLDRTA